jgi:hypothetical protein
MTLPDPMPATAHQSRFQPAWRLSSRDADFAARFTDLLAAKREVSEDVDRAVAAIISDVRARGDAALYDYSERFDSLDLSEKGRLRSQGAGGAGIRGQAYPRLS